ncbi:hypothetical protein [Paenibacillus albus]|uniref:Uncharacterized protein n=1 Tax=Paenibacillus albus TaxID=2495582 RepID=A0A3Q8X9D1_9BACL|nr:hypothetical protein [Paenibacillus albus]AZN43350.1 hypothetical protein EJC50_29415 [Paenibacillus albus]
MADGGCPEAVTAGTYYERKRPSLKGSYQILGLVPKNLVEWLDKCSLVVILCIEPTWYSIIKELIIHTTEELIVKRLFMFAIVFILAISFCSSSISAADNTGSDLTFQTRARIDFKLLSGDTLKTAWKLPKPGEVSYDVIDGNLRLSSNLEATGIWYANTIKTFAISPDTWYKIELDGGVQSGALSAFIFFEGYTADGTKVQTEYFNSDAKYFAIKTASNVTRFRIGIRLAGAGELSVNKFTLYEVKSNSYSLDWGTNKVQILNYLKTVDMSKLLKNYNVLLPGPLNKDYISSANQILNEGEIQLYTLGEFTLGNGWASSENDSYKRLLHGHFSYQTSLKRTQQRGTKRI